MGLAHNPSIVRDGLVLYIDPANTKSYIGSGTDVTDISSGALTGTLDGVGFNAANNGTFVFDGLDDEALIDTPGDLNIFTVEAWAYPTGYSGSSCIVSDSYPGTTSTVNYCILSNGVWRGGLFQAGWYYSPTMTQALDEWQHVVYTYDGTNQTIYKNGVSGGSTTTYSGSPINSTVGIKLGRRWDLTDFHEGNLGSVKIYNRALLADEITQNFEATRGRYGI